MSALKSIRLSITKKINSNPLVRGSFVLLVFMNIFNFLNYLFQFITARWLSVTEYGFFIALMNLAYFLSIPSDSIQLISSRNSSEIIKKEGVGGLKDFTIRMHKKLVKFSVLAFFIFVLGAFILSWFWKKDLLIIIFTGILIFPVFLAPINRGVLQARKKFKELGILFVVEALVKIVVALGLLFLGLKIYGAMAGVILGLAFSFLISFFYTKDIFKSKIMPIKINGKYNYGFSVFFFLFIIMAALSMDVIIAARYLSPENLGLYSVGSLLGKTIFFATLPIAKAMFPFSSEEKNKKTKKVWVNSLKITFLIGMLAIIFFIMFPEFIVRILFSSKYLGISPYIIYLGISFLLLSLANINSYYFLANCSKEKKDYLALGLMLFGLIIAVALLISFNSSILQYCISLLIGILIIFLISLINILKWKK